MPQVELVKDPEHYFQLLTCQSTEVKNIQFVNDECVEMYYTRGDDFIPTSDKTNVVIAAFTTAHAHSESICLEIPNFIKRDPKTKTLHSVQLKKKYNLVYDKRVICGFRTYPYGFR